MIENKVQLVYNEQKKKWTKKGKRSK